MIPLDDVMTFDVVTHNPATGGISDADSTPTYDVFEETTDTPILAAQTLTKRTSKTGDYRGTITTSAANGFEVGKWYSVVCTAVVNSITGKTVAKSFKCGVAEVTDGLAMAYTNAVSTAAMQFINGGIYSNGMVTIDTVGGSSGTTPYLCGVDHNATNSLANADTIAASVDLHAYNVLPGSTITLAGAYTNWRFVGTNWTLVLGSQVLTNVYIEGATVSGTAHASSAGLSFAACTFGATTMPPCAAAGCGLTSTLTLSATGTYTFDRCYDAAAAGFRPVIDMGTAVGATEFHLSNYDGEVAFQNIKTGDEVDVTGQGVVENAVSSTGGTMTVTPNFTVLNSGATTVTRTNVGMGELRVAGDFATTGNMTVGVNFAVGGNHTVTGNYLVTGTTTHTGVTLYSGAVTFASGIVGNITGNLSGSVGSVTGAVGSVTGAVGSVTGNVGGNVVGSVASVTGNVGGNVTGSVGSVVGNLGGNVSGNVVGSVGSVVGSVGSVVGAVGSVTGNVGGNVVGTVGSVVGSVGSVAAGGITAGSIATDAIGSDELAASACTKIVAALAAEIIKGTYTVSDLQKDLAAAVGGTVTLSGTVYTVPGTGWGVTDTQMAVTGASGDRVITRS